MKKSTFLILLTVIISGNLVTSCKEEIASISINPSTIEIKQNETATLELVYEPAEGVLEKTEWTSYDEYIVSVSNDGIIKGLSNGKTTIRLDINNKFSAYCEVKVVGNRLKIGGKEYPITEAKLIKDAGYFIEDLTQYTLFLNYKKGSEKIETFYSFLSSSSSDIVGTYSFNDIPINGALLAGGITPHLVAGIEQSSINSGKIEFRALTGENNYEVEINVNCVNGKNLEGYYKGDVIPMDFSK
jgi:hypothetical protein